MANPSPLTLHPTSVATVQTCAWASACVSRARWGFERRAHPTSIPARKNSCPQGFVGETAPTPRCSSAHVHDRCVRWRAKGELRPSTHPVMLGPNIALTPPADRRRWPPSIDVGCARRCGPLTPDRLLGCNVQSWVVGSSWGVYPRRSTPLGPHVTRKLRLIVNWRHEK